MGEILSPENAKFLQDVVARGEYPSEKDALDDAVALLRRREAFRRDVQAGRAQARAGQLLSADEVFSSLEEELAEIETAAQSKRK